VEASTLHPAASLTRHRVAIGGPLLRLRSDEQLVELFRAGSDEAFRAIHDRYQKRLFAYARQMLPGRQDAEDALQEVFVRAYSGLRSSDRELALRAWLFRIAHNRCIDELRKPSPPPPEVLQLVRPTSHDPLVEIDLRESLRRLVEDIRRLPEQQRSALLMRELGGMSYAELSASLGISLGAVKSLLVRARLTLAEASEARDTSCAVIRSQLVDAHDRGLRPNANARKHMRDCVGCKSFRRELRGVSRQLAATAPTLGPLGFLANLLGFSGGAGGGAAGGAGGGAALFGGSGASASAGGLAVGVNHVATLLVAAVIAVFVFNQSLRTILIILISTTVLVAVGVTVMESVRKSVKIAFADPHAKDYKRLADGDLRSFVIWSCAAAFLFTVASFQLFWYISLLWWFYYAVFMYKFAGIWRFHGKSLIDLLFVIGATAALSFTVAPLVRYILGGVLKLFNFYGY